jgi:hypothetical protein
MQRSVGCHIVLLLLMRSVCPCDVNCGITPAPERLDGEVVIECADLSVLSHRVAHGCICMMVRTQHVS